MNEGNYLQSVVASRDAFENARHEKTKHSTLRIRLLPALLEPKFDRMNLHYMLREIGEELEAIGLGIDARDYNQFEDYLAHIPIDYCVDRRGQSVMQGEWNEQDAHFCYNFAATVIFQWQSERTERFNPVALPDKHEWETMIAGVIIPRETEMGCGYFQENGDEMETFFVSSQLKDQLLNLRSELSTKKEGKVYVNDVLERVYSYSIILLGSYARVATNNPERWEVILWWRPTSEIESQVLSETSPPVVSQ